MGWVFSKPVRGEGTAMSSKAQRGRDEAERRDHYADVTDRMIAALEAGTPPWRKPWDPDKAGGPAMPRNAVTGARYKGINTIVLGMSPLAFESADPRWATYKQSSDRGWQVKKGERGTTGGYFFKRLEVRDDRADPRRQRGGGDQAHPVAARLHVVSRQPD